MLRLRLLVAFRNLGSNIASWILSTLYFGRGFPVVRIDRRNAHISFNFNGYLVFVVHTWSDLADLMIAIVCVGVFSMGTSGCSSMNSSLLFGTISLDR